MKKTLLYIVIGLEILAFIGIIVYLNKGININNIDNNKPISSFSGTLTDDTGFKMENGYITGIEAERTVSDFDLGLDSKNTVTIVDKNNTEKTSGYIFTGDKIKVKSSDGSTKKYIVVIKGDVNGDGKITPIDYVRIKNHIMETNLLTDTDYLLAADYNEDENISSLDYVKVKNHIMNRSSVKYSITYNSNGGSGNMSKQEVIANETTNLTRNTFTNEGHSFRGWNTEADGKGTTYKEVSKIKVTGNVTLYAQWKQNASTTYTVTFNTNGGSGGQSASIQATYGNDMPIISSTKPTKQNYIFIGWYNNTDYTKGTKYYDENGKSVIKYNVKDNMTLYAGWMDQNTFIVKYDCNGGTGGPSNQYVKNGSGFIPAANTCTKTGYVFDGWYDASNNDLTFVYQTANFKNDVNGVKDNTFVLTAAWDKELPTNNDIIKPRGSVQRNGKIKDFTYDGECDNSKINKSTDSINMSANHYCSYESDTLKYYIIMGEKTGGKSRYVVTHIWVKDPSNQLRVAIAEEDSNPSQERINDNIGNTMILKEQVGRDIITQEINKYHYENKGLVGINASAMINDTWAKSAPLGWRGQAQLNVFRNKGKTIRNNGNRFSTDIQYGLAKDGHLKAYTPQNTTAGNNMIKNYIEKVDEIKDVFGFRPVLVKKGKSQVGINNIMSWNDDGHSRQAVCQIDKNNFVLISSIRKPDKNGDNSTINGLSLTHLVNMMLALNCYTGLNLDGGGSTNYYYKGKSSTLVGPLSAHDGRISADILYFVEK